MKNEIPIKKTEEHGMVSPLTFIKYAPKRVIEVDYPTYNQEKDRGFYTLGVKYKCDFRLYLGSVGHTDFSDLIGRISEYFFDQLLVDKPYEDKSHHDLMFTEQASERLGPENKTALERLVNAYNKCSR